MFQNLIAGGQTKDGMDATNELSFMCIQATMHVLLPQPSFSVRVWNGSPHEFLLKAAQRHRVFNYRNIAEYYAQASPEMQDLMEKSALVIIDYEDAIANGYVRLSERLKRLRDDNA
jgi:hypothetical protein